MNDPQQQAYANNQQWQAYVLNTIGMSLLTIGNALISYAGALQQAQPQPEQTASSTQLDSK